MVKAAALLLALTTAASALEFTKRHHSGVLSVARGGADLAGDDDSSDALFGGGDEDAAKQSMSELLGGLPGFPPPGALNGENLGEYEKMMETFMDSPLMQEFLSDPEKMEMSRQALLNNPMALQLMKSMPGLEEILHDKEKWRERMLASKAQFDAMRKAKQEQKQEESEPADDFED